MFGSVDLVEMEEQAAKLADLDPTLGSNTDLLGTVEAVERVRSLLDIAEAHHLAELDRRDVCDEEYGLRTKGWLAHTADISSRTAGSRVKTATRLRHMPAMDAAVTSGALSSEHAHALAADATPRVLPALADVDEQIVALADGLGFDRWRTEVRRLLALLDQDGTEPDETTNRLRFADTLDGRTYVDGAMTADLAAIVRDAVEARADELYHQRRRDAQRSDELTIPPRATLRMLALVDLVRDANHGGTASGRAEVHLIVHNTETTDRHGHAMPRAATGVWGCDPDLWAFVVDDMGIPLDVGHAHRYATPALRRAVALRDGGCVFPGCTQPAERCDLHHVVPFPNGPTSLDNLATLCRHHHTVTHRPRWTMHTTGPGTYAWTTPQHRTLTNRPPPQPDG